MTIPDVIGLTLGEARRLLNEADINNLYISVTAPPKHKTDQYEDSYRVIRLSGTADGRLELLVCKPL